MLGWLLLGAVLLVWLGLLLGAAWSTSAFQSKLGQQAEERRRLNEEWSAVRTARRQRGACPRCATPLSKQDLYFVAEDPADDDLHGGVAVVDPSDSSALSSAKTASSPINAGASRPSSRSFQKTRLSVVREQGWGRDSLVSTTLPITIYLSDESAHKQVEAAVEDLLVATGGHIEHRDDPVLGSWFRRMRAKVSEFADSPLGHEAKTLAAHAAESWVVHAQDATNTATMLQNLGPVLAALQSTKEAVIRVGALLIVKMDSTLVVHQLTSAQQLQLDHQPQLAQSPHDILSVLQLRPSSSAQSADGVA
jgi:type II secretory pathway pseudopilin PulG